MKLSPEQMSANPLWTKHENGSSEISAEQISLHEKKDHNREKLTEILTGPDAYKEILALAKSGDLRILLKEVDDLREVRHTVPGNKAQFHKEGDVFRHTLRVLRAPNLPEVSDLIEEIYPSDSEESVGFFDKTSPELAWSLLLHDIGKKQTQKVALDHADNIIGHYKFKYHGQKAAEAFRETIAQRFNFSEQQTDKIAVLIADHMLMHKLMRGKENLEEEELELMMNHPLKEELLWHAFFDSVGNYTAPDSSQETTKATFEQKKQDFKAAWNTLMKNVNSHDNMGDTEEGRSKSVAA